nr:immunoglobulin heavy chain junction region [Macaca mulatta]
CARQNLDSSSYDSW